MNGKIKNIAILGSTGSIGKQALDVVRLNIDKFKVRVLTSNTSSELLISQAIEFRPDTVIIADPAKYQEVKSALAGYVTDVQSGIQAIAEVVTGPDIDIVLTALVGYCGLLPTINALRHGKTVALANKETLVVAGDIVMRTAAQNRAPVIPVDSEHSAIFQCLLGEKIESVEKLILTASGGPFLGKNSDFLKSVTPAQALRHPNWTMGSKITIDSASLMNKGLEIIEAKWLFDLPSSKIDVVVHPQSIIHSMVQFVDGSIKAQLGVPDMKLPIQYAFGYPDRISNINERYNFLNGASFTFLEPDSKTFRNLALAIESLEQGGNMPCILNAANEVVVAGFLNNQLGFLEMSEVIENCMKKINFIKSPRYDDFVETDSETRKLALSLI